MFKILMNKKLINDKKKNLVLSNISFTEKNSEKNWNPDPDPPEST